MSFKNVHMLISVYPNNQLQQEIKILRVPGGYKNWPLQRLAARTLREGGTEESASPPDTGVQKWKICCICSLHVEERSKSLITCLSVFKLDLKDSLSLKGFSSATLFLQAGCFIWVGRCFYHCGLYFN